MRNLNDGEIRTLGFNPEEFDRMCALTETNSIIRYVKGIYSGFISHGKVITDPLFTPSARIIAYDHIITDFFKSPAKNYNTSVMIDANTGEQLIKNFGAYFVDGPYIAFRVNGPTASEHRWGIYSLNENRLIQAPTIRYEHIHNLVNSFLGKVE